MCLCRRGAIILAICVGCDIFFGGKGEGGGAWCACCLPMYFFGQANLRTIYGLVEAVLTDSSFSSQSKFSLKSYI